MKSLAFARQITPASIIVCHAGGNEAWNLARRYNSHGLPSVVLPAGADPKHYDWSLFKGRTLFLFADSRVSFDYLRDIITQAVIAGAVEAYSHTPRSFHAYDPAYLGGQ